MVWWLLSFFTFSFNWDTSIAQSNVSCLPFYNWTYNSVQQSPCQVASSLLAVCNDGPFLVSALPDMSHHYVGPSVQDANSCQCNTVTYSLMSACGACQGNTYLSWSVWSANCPIVYLSSYPKPIPSGVFVPGWAYLDADDGFDQSLARMNANLTQSTAVPSPTSTQQSTTLSSTISSTALIQSTSAPSSLGPSTSNVFDADATGGVVGGLLGLFILCTLLYGYIHWKRRLARNGEHLSSRTDTENPASREVETPSMTQVRAINSTPSRSESAIPSFNYSLSTPAMSTSNSSISRSIDFVRSPEV